MLRKHNLYIKQFKATIGNIPSKKSIVQMYTENALMSLSEWTCFAIVGQVFEKQDMLSIAVTQS